MQQINQYLSSTLKLLRTERGWSLERAARETGVSKAMLGQIERGESSPTIATLWKVAGGFSVPLSLFIEPPTQNVVVRVADELRQQPAEDDMLVAPLFAYTPEFGFEMFELTLLPGYERYSEPHEPGITEHVIVLEGEMELLLAGQWVTMTKGAAVRFTADVPHGYRNLSLLPAVFHNLIHYPAAASRAM